MKKKRNVSKVKEIKRVIGRLQTPAPKVIPDKRRKLLDEAEKKLNEE